MDQMKPVSYTHLILKYCILTMEYYLRDDEHVDLNLISLTRTFGKIKRVLGKVGS